MGVVYEADDPDTGKRVAIKTLPMLEASALYRFKREFRALVDVRHPNLVELYELVSDDGRWFYTMELVDGVDFLRWVRGGQVYEDVPTAADDQPHSSAERLSRVRRGFHQLASGIATIHAAGKVHRDIKPGNILVTREGRVVVLDFGLIGDRPGEDVDSDSIVVGTAMYMAPEQGGSHRVGPAADWYSVGVVLYQSLTGKTPFAGAPLEVLALKQRTEPMPPRSSAPELPDDLNDLCMELLSRSPGARPTGDQILARLEQETPEAPATKPVTTESSSRAAPFVGREPELGELMQRFEGLADTGARVVCVTGELGVGKTTLAARMASRITKKNPSAVVLTGRTHERESVPYKALDGVIDSLSEYLSGDRDISGLLPDDVGLACQLFPVLGRVRAIAARHSKGGVARMRADHRGRAFAALRTLFARMAERSPLVLIVDDFQWADADSLALVVDLMQGEGAPPMLFVWTMRVRRGDPLPASILAACERIGIVDTIELGPLGTDDSVALASALYERATGDELSDPRHIADEAKGHPLVIEELVRVIATANDGVVGAAHLDDALLSRIRVLDDATRRVLRFVATAGVPLTLPAIARAAELESVACSRAVATLCARNLLRLGGQRDRRDVAPYHERVRDVVLREMPDEERTRTHSALAASLISEEASERDPQVVIRHLIMAGDVERAADEAEMGAARASGAFAFDRAAELYRVALRLAEYDDAREREVRLALARTLSLAGRGADAADVYLSVAEAATAPIARDCRRLASEQLLLTGHIERGLRVLSSVLSDFDVSLPSTPRRSLALLLWNRARLRLRGMKYSLREEAAIAPADLARLDLLQAVGSSMAVVDNICGAYFQARALLLALRVGERQRIARSIATEAMVLGSQGKVSAAATMLDRGWKLVEVNKDSYVVAYLLASRGVNHHFCGRFRAALRDFDDAEELWMSSIAGGEFELSIIRIFRMYGLRFLGDCRELRRQFDLHAREAERRGDRHTETTLTRAFNMVWLVDDDPQRARDDLASAGWAPPKEGYHIQHWFKLRARVELQLYVGDGGATRQHHDTSLRRLKSSMLLRIKVIRSDFYYLNGRLLLAEIMAGSGDRKALQDQTLAIAKKLDAEHLNYTTVWAHMLRGAVLAQRGKHTLAIVELKKASEVAKRGDMELFTAVIRRRRGQLIGGHEGAMMVAHADEWMREHGVRNPARMSSMWMPGFDETLQI
jgi:tRNA A-37 threonylcarbamoyl transferase component Bud32